MKRKGFFVCVEGLDGCGKTTQARLLVESLKDSYDAVYTAEPTDGEIGKFIKSYCLHGKKRRSSVVEALLYAADRFEHVEKELVPALEAGKLVISDRYVYSSLAYQGAAGLDLDWIKRINEHAVRPDLAVFIDVEPEAVVQRLKPKRSVLEDLETQRQVHEVYLRFVDEGELKLVNGNASKEKVAAEVLELVLGFLEKTC